MNQSPIFHLAIPINDVEKAKQFYQDGLGCEVGRENPNAVIFNFYGHQVVAHVTKENLTPAKSIYPRHFGLIFTEESQWELFLNRVKNQELLFYQEPKIRFLGELTEHRTFFLEDPFYNILEIKFYRHFEAIFGGKNITAIGDRS
jgi:uncharacterized protein